MRRAGVAIASILAWACAAPKAPPPPQPTFACGERTCDARTSYCERQLSDTKGPEIDACKPLPDPCRGAADCGCFPEGTPCILFKQCSATPAGDRVGLTVACPGG